MAGIPDRGRPVICHRSLVKVREVSNRHRQYSKAIKFQTFQDQYKAALLHNDDVRLQNQTQEQKDAQDKAFLDNTALANSPWY